MRGRIEVMELVLHNNWGTDVGKYLALIATVGRKRLDAIRCLLPVTREIANAVFIAVW